MAIINTAVNDGDHDLDIEAMGVKLPSKTFQVKKVSFYRFGDTRLAFNITKNNHYYSNINTISMSGIFWYDSNLRLRFPKYSSMKVLDSDNTFMGIGANSVIYTDSFTHLFNQSCSKETEKYHGYTCLASVKLIEYRISIQTEYYVNQKRPYVLNEAYDNVISTFFTDSYPNDMLIPLIAGFKYTSFIWIDNYHSDRLKIEGITITNATGWVDADPSIQMNILLVNHFNIIPTVSIDSTLVANQTAMWNSSTINSLLNGDYYLPESNNHYCALILNGKRGNTIQFNYTFIVSDQTIDPPNPPPDTQNNQSNPTNPDNNNNTSTPPSTPLPVKKPRIIVALTTYAENTWSNKTLWPNETFPEDKDYVIIPDGVAVKLDINPPKLDTLIVRGGLIIDNEDDDDMVINFGQIIVTGFFIAGTVEEPLTRNVAFDLSRKMEKTFPIPAEKSLCGAFYNCFAVNGTLSIVFDAPLINKYNILAKSEQDIVLDGFIGDDWQIGDEIVVFDPSKIQTANITAKNSYSSTLRVEPNLIHEPRVREIIVDPITNDNLILSTEVALLSRQIIVKSNGSAKLFITSRNQNSFCSLIGVKFQSFEVEIDSFAATKKTLVKNNVFTKNAGDRALSLRSGDGYQVTNNLFFAVSGTALSLSGTLTNTEVRNNLFIRTQNGLSIGAQLNNSEITLNTIVGASGSSVIIRGLKCTNSKIKLNHAHSGTIGLDAYENIDDNCYDSSVFFLGNLMQNGAKFTTFGNQLTIKRLALIGCKNGITLRCTTPDTMQTIITQNYIKAYSPNQSDCSSFKAIEIPSSNDVRGDHVWTTDFQITGNTFENYNFNSVQKCKDNRILTVPFSSFEGTDIATFGLNNMVNCENSSAFVLPSEDIYSNPNCGGWACTGLSNYIIKDPFGTLFGKTSTILPMNSALVADDKTCVLNDMDKGYVCPNRNWALLAFESEDGDKFSRLITPIYVISSSGSISKINSHGKHTQGLRRLSRFWSVLQANRSYTIEYTADLPKKFHFQLQGAASPYDWVIIKQRYTVNQIIKVDVRDVTGPTIVDEENPAFTADDPCGTSIYVGVNQTIEFKLTGASDCDVVLKVISSVKGKVRYAMSIEDFFKKDGPTAFADNVALVLGIDLSRIRVVSVVKGSVIVEFHIFSLEANTTASADVSESPNGEPGNATNQEDTHLAELEALSAKLLTAMSSTQMNLFNATVLDFEFNVVSDKSEENNKNESVNLLAIILPIIIGTVLITIIIGTVLIIAILVRYYYKKKRLDHKESAEIDRQSPILRDGNPIVVDQNVLRNEEKEKILPKREEKLESKEKIQSPSLDEIMTIEGLIKDSVEDDGKPFETGIQIENEKMTEF